ncbi:hypothetical protein [Streptomyces sp. BE303]|uniref:hypothetical protein n=1 Tax=Streptomyces sp. BE303 TaxID=3002528 RepID=UPI002E7846E2|nr:hypothetical protein [Streptomyces sp. BE303]MED7948944.1 hypothetical protein [Streptomyces sp. BE303]
MTTKAGATAPVPTDAHRPAPWVRTRLRSAPVASLLTGVLTLLTVFLAVALPRAADRGADGALRQFVLDRGVNGTTLQAGVAPRPGEDGARLDALRDRLVEQITPNLPLTRDGENYGTRARIDRPMLNEGYDRPHGDAPVLSVLYLHGLAEHATLTEGVWPGPSAPGEPLPVVLSRAAAETVHAGIGDLVDNGGPARARIVGLYRADDPDDRFWEVLTCPERACLKIREDGSIRWVTSGFTGGENLSALAAWGEGGENFWRLPIDPHALRADRLAETRSALASYLSGPGSLKVAEVTDRPELQFSTFLTEVLAGATTRYEAAAPLAAIGPAGVAGVATVVLCLAAALAADRRAAEIRLLRARGASRPGILLRLLGEGAVTVLPAAAVATALALTLLPTPRWGAAVLAAVTATLLAVLAFPVRAVLPPGRARTAAGGNGRRRIVGELAVLAVTVAAVVEVRRRGLAPGTGTDPLLVTAPLLLALTGGLLLARVQPLVAGRLALLARHGRGLTGFLGLARATRDASGRHRPAVLAPLALLLAVSTAGFGTTVLATLDGVRLQAARTAVGGDAAVSVPLDATLPAAFTSAASAMPGVRASTAVRVEGQTYVLRTGRTALQVTLVVAEPTAYAEIARTTGTGTFDPAVLAGPHGGPDTPVPALISTGLAGELSDGPQRLRVPGGELLTGVAGRVDATPAIPDAVRAFVVVPAGPSVARVPALAGATSWLAAGDIDPGRLRSLVMERGLTEVTGVAGLLREEARAVSEDPDKVPAGYTVRTSGEVDAELAADPLQRSAARLFRSAVAAGAGFALLAVLLTLLRASPDRAGLLARLRTMGLRPRQGLALIITETIPQTLAAAVCGGVVAAAAVGLLGPAFDLSLLVGSEARGSLTPLLMPVLLPTAGLALLICAGVVLEAFVSGRRQIATELRAGDRPTE